MGDGPRRRHETIRLITSAQHVAYRSRLIPASGELTQVDLELPDPTSYQGAVSTLTMPNVTGLRNGLAPGDQAAVPVVFDAPDGSRVTGLAQVADVPGSAARYQVSNGALDCSCGQPHCGHISQATDALAAEMNARQIRSALRDWEGRRGHATGTLAADHAASVAAPRDRPTPDGPSWSEDASHFQAAYDEARTKVANGENPIPYMREDATGGLGAREGGRGFGVEVEFGMPASMSISERQAAVEAIGRDLNAEGLTSRSAQRRYHAGARDGWVEWSFETDGSHGVAGEIVSPIMHDEPQTWEQIEKVCNIVRRHGGTASTSAGGHVSVSMADYDHTVENHNSLVRAVRANEDLLYRLGQNPERRRHRRAGGNHYTGPQPVPPPGGYGSISEAQRRNTRSYTANFQHVNGSAGDHVEYRVFDATLDPAAIQSQINLSLAITDTAFRDHSWGSDATPIGTHYTNNRTELGGRSGARLTGDAWTNDTGQVRSLVDRLFWRSKNRQQIAALYATTRWERP